jgi:hypothetical protein
VNDAFITQATGVFLMGYSLSCVKGPTLGPKKVVQGVVIVRRVLQIKVILDYF